MKTKEKTNIRLPITDEFGFYEIRFESIGGLGAHLAGQILGEASVLKMGLNGAHFSSYGSEKKGSPVKSFVRLCVADQEIRTNSPIETPHMIAVFHDALLKNPTVLAGLRQGGTLIINSGKPYNELKEYLKTVESIANIYIVDALSIAVSEKSRVNTAMMGATIKLSGFLNANAILEVLDNKFKNKHPKAVEPNRRAFMRGAEEVKLAKKAPKNIKIGAKGASIARPGPVYGYETAPIGGTVIAAGSTATNDMSASRQGFLPVLDSEKCIQCGLCDLVCPDNCLVWEPQKDAKSKTRNVGSNGHGTKTVLKGVDYNFCKGCMRCVDSCPSAALTKEREIEGFAKTHRAILFPHLEKKK
ncbi:2-oxoacid:acceptor oxidoreductase family protein [Elusimicrobiota bacterium]